MKRKIFLSAVLLPCILFSIAAIAFKTPTGKPAISTEQIYDDSDVYWALQEAALDDIAYDTWVNDGSPGGDDMKSNANGSTNHYCCKTSDWYDFTGRSDRSAWVGAQMGPGNSNHVHYIQWETSWDGPFGPPGFPSYRAKVKYWTSAPCSEICDW